jgi:hypothetical protein
MLLNTLESLVLRNVNVANGRLTLEMLRQGPDYQTDSQTPEITISSRHPSQRRKQEHMRPAMRFDDAVADGVVATAIGAGRSRRRAGVLCRQSSVLAAAQAVPCERLRANGGAEPLAAVRLCREPAERAATGSVSNFERRLTARTVSFTTGKRDLPKAVSVNKTRPAVRVVWCKPATPTLPVSARGKGVW